MPSPEDIIAIVEKKFLDTAKLRQRMDDDYNQRWRLEKYQSQFLTGYETYTSNDSKTFARKGVALLNGAMMSIKCPQNNDPRETRDQDNAKEQFAIGNLKANDERLGRMGLPPLRRSMDFHTLIRGFTTGRCTFIKRGNRCWADATPWDPREVAWEYGPEGLAWICRRYAIPRSAADREWRLAPVARAEDSIITIYDWYDTYLNTVVIPDIQREPVKSLAHGGIDGYKEPRVPGWCYANPMQPPVQSTTLSAGPLDAKQLGDLMADYGESIFSENRETWDTHNFNMSLMKNLAGRSLKPVFGIQSATGTKLVEGDPFKSGAEIPLAEGEKLIVYDMLQSAPDLVPYMMVNQGEMQRGGFSVIMHGDSPLPISGIAMHTLKSGQGDKVLSAALAIELAIKDITNMWCDQYVSGAFGNEGIRLSGQGGNRKWFVATITPDMLRDLPELEVKIMPQFPEDDEGKIQQALALRQPGPGGLPLMSDYDIREDRLERQNSDQDLDTILQEMAGIHPLVQAHRYADALAKRGDEGAQYWQGQWMMLVIQAMQAGLLPFGIQETPDMPGSNATNGFSPGVLPNAGQGKPAPRPGIETPYQSGPNVPPGTPRPRAQGRNGGGLRQGVPPIP